MCPGERTRDILSFHLFSLALPLSYSLSNSPHVWRYFSKVRRVRVITGGHKGKSNLSHVQCMRKEMFPE